MNPIRKGRPRASECGEAVEIDAAVVFSRADGKLGECLSAPPHAATRRTKIDVGTVVERASFALAGSAAIVTTVAVMATPGRCFSPARIAGKRRECRSPGCRLSAAGSLSANPARDPARRPRLRGSRFTSLGTAPAHCVSAAAAGATSVSRAAPIIAIVSFLTGALLLGAVAKGRLEVYICSNNQLDKGDRFTRGASSCSDGAALYLRGKNSITSAGCRRRRGCALGVDTTDLRAEKSAKSWTSTKYLGRPFARVAALTAASSPNLIHVITFEAEMPHCRAISGGESLVRSGDRERLSLRTAGSSSWCDRTRGTTFGIPRFRIVCIPNGKAEQTAQNRRLAK